MVELFHRVLELPMVEIAMNFSASTYSRVKDSNQLVYWALSTAESSLTQATRQAAPIAKRFETPITIVDQKLCQGLDKIEKKMPIVRQTPNVIMENTYLMILEAMMPTVQRISNANEFVNNHANNIKETSWKKVNEILSTHYGSVMVDKFDNTAEIVDMLIDKYFPPLTEEKYAEVVSVEEDKLLHTLQRLGRLSNKAAHRVYSHVAHQLRILSKDNLRAYLSALVHFLQMARNVNAINSITTSHNSSSSNSTTNNGIPSTTSNGKPETINNTATSTPKPPSTKYQANSNHNSNGTSTKNK
ncbi:hypothetical protein QAD02_018948 [Eretmocerus hayati]|uniref:Uncharacterized protein n=1 Tax=Eretmocerus hayati TaxID=131215 RepID=A0ACC2PK10_9HYME|nr:hypothetical protein QAD02_018948 [Eretmocerus hayati]